MIHYLQTAKHIFLPLFYLPRRVCCIGLMALAALLAYLGGYRDRCIVRTVAGFPLFMAAWLPLQLVSLVSRTRSWQPIAHTRAVRAESLRGAGFLTTI